MEIIISNCLNHEIIALGILISILALPRLVDEIFKVSAAGLALVKVCDPNL